MNSRNRLLIIAPYFPPHPGGLEYYALHIAQQLQQNHNWDIVVITTAERGRPYNEESMGPIKVYSLPYKLLISNTPFSIGWFRCVRKIIKLERPDIVNVHTPVPGLADIGSLMSGRLPVVVTYHAGSMVKGNKWIDAVIWLYEHVILRIMLHKARRIVCSSDFVRNGIVDRYLSKSQTITPAADEELFYPAKARVPKPRLLFVGSLNISDSYKGLSYLLEAVRKLKSDIPGIHLTVVGQGDNREHMEQEARHMGLERNVTFTGRLEGVKLAEAYRKSSIFVLPSDYDSFPMVIIEAMATALPVISTNTGGIPSLVDDGIDGLLLEPRDATGLAQTIQKLIVNPTLQARLGKAGRAKVLDRLTWSGQAEATNDMLAKILSDTRGTDQEARNMGVTHIIAYYPPHLGGMERVAQELGTQLVRDEYTVNVITSKEGAKYSPGYETVDGVHIRRLKGFEVAHTPIMPSLLWRLWRIPKPTVFHLHMSQAYIAELTWLVAKIRGIPYVVHFHLDVGRSGRLGFLLPMYKKYVTPLVMRGAKHVIALSPEQAEFIAQKFKIPSSRVSFIPNGVSEQFLDIPRTKPGKDKTASLLFVGRLSPQKRVDRLLEAMALIKEKCELVIVGDGEEREALEAQVKKMKLANVKFAGAHSGEKLIDYYRQADIFVLPSDIEGMPLALLEAMAAALPVVGSDVIGIHELVEGVGLLVPNPSAETFAAVLTKAIKDDSLLAKLSEQSHKKAQHYTWPIITKRFEAIYGRITT